MVNNSIAAQLQRLDKTSKGPAKVIKKKSEKDEAKMSPKDARMKEAKELIKTYKITNGDGEPIELGDKVTIKDLAYLKEYVKTHTTPTKKSTTDSTPPKPVKKSGKKRNPEQIFKNLSQDELKDLCGSEYFNLSKYGNKQELQERLGDFLDGNPSSLMWFTGPQLEMLCKKNDISLKVQKDRAKPVMAKALEELM